MRGEQRALRRRARTGRRSGESPGVSVAGALSWAVLHAKGRVTPSIRSAFAAAIYEFATHREAIGRHCGVDCYQGSARRACLGHAKRALDRLR
jgi:hypothetical protein